MLHFSILFSFSSLYTSDFSGGKLLHFEAGEGGPRGELEVHLFMSYAEVRLSEL